MKLADFTVNVTKTGAAQKEIEGCLAMFGFNVQNNKITSLNARIHEKGETNQVGPYLGQVDMNPETGRLSSNFSGESEDFMFEARLKTACKTELQELRTELFNSQT